MHTSQVSVSGWGGGRLGAPWHWYRSSYEQRMEGQEMPHAPSAPSRWGTVTRQGCHSGEVVEVAVACAFPGLSAG